MLTRLNLTGIQQKRLSEELPRPVQQEDNLESIVASIVDDVKETGDKALKAYAEKYDGGAPESFLVSEEEIEEAVRNCSKDLVTALKHAAIRIRTFHESQIREKKNFELDGIRVFGTTLGHHNSTMEMPEYKKMIINAILWTSGKVDKDGKVQDAYLKPTEK